jgi:YD repeat-containing protein
VEELNWDGQTIFATSIYTYNARDQITTITQENSRVRTFNYDGHGRLQSQITPEQGTTSYTYFIDDLPQTVTDARGAKSTFTYNPRHLVTNVAYDISQAPGVAATPNVSYGYDQAGNRTSMTDGLGSTSYAYDQLSRMTSETRTFTGVGSYTLSYGYNLSGELTSFTNLWNAQVTYGYDKAGRLTNVGGSGYAGVSNYASSLTYRAFGGIKGMSYGNGRSLSVSYDNRMRPTTWNVANVLGYNYNYNYFNEHTGRVTYAQNIADGTLDRSYEYDLVGRLAYSHSGAEARAHAYSGQWGTMDGPYSQDYSYDVWGNITHRHGWGGEVQGGGAGQASDLTYSYDTHNRRTGFSYDNAGNVTFDGGQTFTYDATGQQTNASCSGYSLQQSYDCDRLRVKKVENGVTTYYLRSSVLGGQVVAR